MRGWKEGKEGMWGWKRRNERGGGLERKGKGDERVEGMTRSITAIVVSDMLARCPGVGAGEGGGAV